MFHSKQQHYKHTNAFLTSRSARSSLRTGGEFSPTPADMTMASTLPFRCTMYAPMYFLIRCTYTCRHWLLSPLHYSRAAKLELECCEHMLCTGAKVEVLLWCTRCKVCVTCCVNAEWAQMQKFKSKAQHMRTECSATWTLTGVATQFYY